MEGASHRDPHRVQEAFAEATALPTLSRPAFLASLRAESADLADEVESLLAYHLRADARGESDPTVTLPATLLGKFVGGCRIERLVGYGGMSAVYAATQEFPRRRVAIKIVRRERLGASARRRLRVEAEALARLEHPNIARVYAAGTQRLSDREEDGESPFIVMELIEDAVPLNTWANERRLDARARIELVARIADAIEHAHRAGVIHRDLKPGNVIVGGEGVPKVIDFGIASVHNSTVTQATEGPMGTLAYMSPEQARGQRVDTRSDVWGLGALLYDLLAGTPPFDAEDNSVAAHVDRLLHETPAAIGARARASHGADFAEGIPLACDAVLRKALANDAERRYRGAAELAEELRRLIAGEPLIARPDSEWDSLVRLMRQHRASLSAAAGIFAVTLIALIVALGLLRREREAHDRAQWSAYVASISAASGMLERGDASAARDMLDSAPVEHRGWEWQALSRLSSQSKHAIDCGPGQQVYDTEWSSDGTRIFAAAGDDFMAIDRATRRALWRVPAPISEAAWRVRSMADGHIVARTVGSDFLRIAPEGSVVARGSVPNISDLATDRARTRLFGNDIGGAQEIDPADFRVIRTITAEPPLRAIPTCIAADPGATLLALGSDDGTIVLMSAADGKVRWSVRAPVQRDYARATAFSPDGRVVAAAARSGIVLIDAASGEVRWRSTDASKDYRDCTFTPDGGEVIGSSWAEVVDRFDTASGALKGSIVGAYSQVWNSAVSPDGREIASGTFAARVEIFDAHATSRAEEFTLDGSAVLSIAHRGQRLYAVTANGTLFSLDTARASPASPIAASLHANAVRALSSGELAVAHDGGVAWLTGDGTIRASAQLPSRGIRIGTLASGAITTVQLDNGQVHAFASESGAAAWTTGGFKNGSTVPVETTDPTKVLLARGVGGAQAMLDTVTMTESGALRDIEYAMCGALSPDRRMLAIGSVTRAGELALLDGTARETRALLPNHRGAVRAIAWSPDSSRVASASPDGTVRIWHAERRVEILTAWHGSCRDLAWDDDATLWLACDDGLLRTLRVRD